MILVVVAAFILAACGDSGGNGGSDDNGGGGSTASVVRVTPSNEVTGDVIRTDSQAIDNCEGAGALEQTISREGTVSFTIEEVDGSTVSAGGSVSILGYGAINLGGEIAREYGVTYGQTGTVSDSTTVEVPAGESILYTVEVREKYGTGTFVVEAAGRSDEFPYEILLGIDTTARGESQGCSFLGGLQGTYTLREWRERRPPEDSPVVLGMGVRRGTLTIDEFGHAVWDLDLDSGMEEQFTPGLRCLGIVDETAESLGGITGELEVAGETLKGDQRDWNRNLLSLQADALVAWCGHTFFLQDELFVYDRRMDDYSLSLRVIDANTFVLTMQNVAGTFTWEKD